MDSNPRSPAVEAQARTPSFIEEARAETVMSAAPDRESGSFIQGPKAADRPL
jgi:hypothetical protein